LTASLLLCIINKTKHISLSGRSSETGTPIERKGLWLKALRECHLTKVAWKDAEEISQNLK
jgi:hypothetical protein